MTDLLDRILDKGIVVQADLVICVSDIPLIGINLRAVIAGMDTMLKYGMMEEMDKEIRSIRRKSLSVETGQKV
ncbi:MAG: gas vesicle protein [Chloroflexi bacterium]|nr:gas vesicle protein [Chloroflexota bacterium]